ncbi:prepilin-type N-terminal cleavage/methylation domain-containing protein [Neosynechococcus sphagnicola]|uniref:prepilin-type N-terminal cleavage/methylation domain-containing protein n=1 Tax=Neosynechococcus sphagnicola TaxID=1501145 RepID=UPI000691AE62|nr:prepilin-type N-terminal cleavage/methylation domain-containing protein [Neosynechococcus sphagnicola]
MNTLLGTRLLKRYCETNRSQGFTLIELLVVVIIVGVLAAIAVPNLLNQIGKGRESELKIGIGTINRQQQAYHWEHKIFAPDTQTLQMTINGTILDSVTIVATDPVNTDPTSTTVAAINNEALSDRTRGMSGATYASGGTYETIVCTTDLPAVTGIVPVVSGGLSCAAGTTQLK